MEYFFVSVLFFFFFLNFNREALDLQTVITCSTSEKLGPSFSFKGMGSCDQNIKWYDNIYTYVIPVRHKIGLCSVEATTDLAEMQPDWSSLRKERVTCPLDLSPLTLSHTTKASLPLKSPIPIHPSCHKWTPSTTICTVSVIHLTCICWNWFFHVDCKCMFMCVCVRARVRICGGGCVPVCVSVCSAYDYAVISQEEEPAQVQTAYLLEPENPVSFSQS